MGTRPGETASAESVRATILFADIVGFSALAEKVGPETAYGVVTGCLKLLDGIARRYGGSVDKFLGDALLALFGHPVPLENPARAALSAALEMRQRVEAYNEQLELDLPLGVDIGVNTGTLVSGDVRGPVIREFHVLGDAVNVAARLKSKAPVGEIYVGPETQTEAREHFRFRELEPLVLKGKSRPVPAFALMESRAEAVSTGIGSADTVFSSLVGRTEELARLERCVASLSEGHGGIVALAGEEGSGKSRLLTELGAGDAVRRVRTIQLAGAAEGSSRRFDPTHALSEALELGSSDAEALQAHLARQEEPLLIALEDLQGLDPASLEGLAGWIERSADRPILWLLSFRPDTPEIEKLLGTLRERHGAELSELTLGPLSDAESRALVDRVAADELPEETRELLVERAKGNPQRIVLGVFLTPALHSEAEAREAGRSRESERRRATVLFADLTGFTAMTEKLGSERAYPVVTECMQLLDEVARKHGGTVDKHLGDCVVALFGIPEALEDAPRAAINAALEMRQRVYAYNEQNQLEVPLDVHSGLNTGLGISGDISGPLIREFAVMGDPVDVASELSDLSPAGAIFVGPETHRFTREVFDYRDLEPIPLKGRSEPIPVFELLSREPKLYRARIGAERQVFSELVGREDEFTRLRQRIAGLSEDGGGIVSLIAEAGLGKSRLVDELSRSEEARAVLWLEGRSLSTGQNLSFHPFADLCRAWAEITDDDDDDRTREKLEALAASLLGAEAEERFPFIANVLGLRLTERESDRLREIPGDSLERLTFRAMTELLREGSRQRPLVVVMDDLHWADLSSVELLESSLRLVEEHPLLFVNVFRPGFASTSDRVLEAVREAHPARHEEIRLSPLDASAVRRFLGNLFPRGALPRATRTLIEKQVQGNPFFLEEVIRSLVDEGAAEFRDGAFRATERIHDVTIPGSVQEVVMARVDRLDLRKKQLLQTASVIGRSFHHDVLSQVHGDDGQLDEALEELMAAEFLVPWDRLQGVEYAFKHPLIQEVTYDGILHARREELHVGVAEAIEKRLSPDIPGFDGMLAFHYSMGKVAERAEHYLFRAGDEAARVAASSEALQFFRQALGLYFEMHGDGGDPAKKARLQKNIALALFNKGQLIDAEEHCNEALAYLGVKTPKSERGLLLAAVRNAVSVLARLYVPLPRRLPAATDAVRETMDLMFERGQCEITADPTRFVFDNIDMVARLQRVDAATVPSAGRVFAGASTIFSYGGISFGISRRLLEIAEGLVGSGDLRGEFMYGTTRFLHHLFEGDWDPVYEIEEPMIEEALRQGLLWDVITYLGTHADKKISTGDFAVVRERLEQIAKIWDQFQHELAKSTHYALTMFLALEENRLEDAIVAADAYYEENPEELLHVHALGGKGRAQVLLGDLDGAADTLGACEALVRAAGAGRVPPYQLSNYQRSRYLLDVARLEGATGGRERRRVGRRAAGSRRAALSSAARCASRRTEVYRLAGTHHWLLGSPRQAERWWARSLETGRRLGARPELARTHAEIARAIGSEGESTVAGLDASGHRASARELFGQLGLDGEAASV